jgi:SHS2 domain-containing protein
VRIPFRNGRKPRFEVLEHPADVGFLAYGATLEELFANAALAMLSLGWDLTGVAESQRRELHASGEDTEALLYAWLAELLAVADAEHLVFRRVEVTAIAAGQARGTAYGEKFDKARHRACTYIKAVTYNQISVVETPEGWRARVFLDV